MKDLNAPDVEARALAELLAALKAEGYAFVTPTPATHARVLKHPGKNRARDVRDVLGWSLPFAPDILPPRILKLMADAGVLADAGAGGRLRSTIRVSSLDRLLLVHSAYPTEAEDSVFFGPDSYRFAAFVRRALAGGPPPRRLVDIGAGAGAGGLAAGLDWPEADLILTDLNPKALALARINAAAAGIAVRTVETADLSTIEETFDVAIANPPYIVDPGDRDYRDGGGAHGEALSLKMAEEALDSLSPGGRLLLYTGVAIVEARDPVREGLRRLCAERGATLSYEELDPDVFGEELDGPAYQDVERIAAIGALAALPQT